MPISCEKPMKTENSIDSVTLTIINNYLVNTCCEMGLALMKTSYSSIFNEGLDFSCVTFDRDGEMVAYAEFCPAQIGAILYTMQWTIAEIGVENLKPGDVVMHNDLYRGGCGSEQIIKALAPEITVPSFMDRHETGAWGLFGGKEGASGAVQIWKSGDDRTCAYERLLMSFRQGVLGSNSGEIVGLPRAF